MKEKLALTPTNVRFDPATLKRLKRVATQHRLKPSLLIRDAVHEKLTEWERSGVKFQPHTNTAA
jgi:hypothetical protein